MNYLSQVAGQEQAVEILSRSLKSDMLSHAYIFIGPAGVGKMHTAMAFARDILSQSDGEADKFFKNNMHPDLMVIEKSPEKTVIIKEQITGEMEPWLQLKPYRAARRIVIIRDAHLMRNEVANSLLITLEEAPLYAIIILISDENQVLDTILSRCQLIRFHGVRQQIIEEMLLQQGVEKFKAYQASHLANGSIGSGLRYAHEEDFAGRWEIARSIVTDLASGQTIGVYTSAEKMERDPDLISSILETVLRDIYIYNLTNKEELLAIPENNKIAAAIKTRSHSKIKRAIERVNSLRELYRTNVNSHSINHNICWEVWEAFR